MYQLIRQIQPNYVLSYTIKPVIYGTLAAMLAKVPHRFALITGLGYAFQNAESGKRSIFQKMVHGLYAHALKHAHKVFFQNPDDLKLFQKYATGIASKTDGGGEWFWGECAGFCSTGFA